MYWKDVWRFRNSNEYEHKYAGNYGAKGEKRARRKKATPEQIKKQNQANREKKMRRLIKENFIPTDMWNCLKYPAGTRKTVEEYKDDLSKFLDKMRKQYKKRGEVFKFVYRMEVSKRGGVHIHILINRLCGQTDTDILVQKAWKHGRVNFENIYESGGYEDLANYIVKPLEDEEWEQLTMFPEEDRKEFVKYSTSRNLVRPEPERKVYSRWTMRKLIEEGPKPTPGYYIDKNSIVCGINPYTGMSYYHYTEYRINPINSRDNSEKLRE